jgi:peroxiredoxin
MGTLAPGDRFPSIELAITDGSTLKLPDGLGTGWSVILFYRGHF